MKKSHSVRTIILAGSLLLQLSALFHLHSRRAGRWAALGLLAALAFGPPPARAAVTEAWVQRYSNMANSSNDKAVKVVRDAAGDIIVTGSSDDGVNGFDMLTIKYSGANGSVLWQRRYNNPGGVQANDDQARALAVDGNGNVVVMGSSYHSGSGNDWYTAKYAAADGALLWEKRYNGPGNDHDKPLAMAVDGSGNVVVMGSSGNGTNYGYYTIKYAAADGALLWAKGFNDPAANRASAMAVDSAGNVVVTGSSYTARYAAADGALLWEKFSSASGTSALAVDGSGNVVTGSARANDEDGNYFDYYMVKYAAADGARFWAKGVTDPEVGSDDFSAMVLDGNGNVVVARSALTVFIGGFVNTDYHTAKYAAADGALLWEKLYSGLVPMSEEHARAVAVDGSGNVIVTGNSTYFQAGEEGHYDSYTAKYAAADGAILWEKRSNHPANSLISANSVAVDASGDVVVTGISNTNRSEFGNDYYTVKYAAASGALLWEKLYNGQANSEDKAHAVAVDGSGNVVVTGYSFNGTNNDYYTAKYAAADGALLWEQRYGGEAKAVVVDTGGNVVVTGNSATIKYREDGTTAWIKPGYWKALAVDSRGNVVVTGSTLGFPNSDYHTAKYAAADGALLWEKHYSGRAGGYDSANAVAVDPSGNVIVTGTSIDNFATGYDYYTAKYAAANGALLWEHRYHASYKDLARAIAVDASGNVVVTGGSGSGCAFGAGCDYRYYTAKYAAANGALLWERYSTGDVDFANAVAVDASGNVVVTGSSGLYDENGETFGEAYYTAKYAAANGALLWEKRGPGGVAHAVALDGGGNAVVAGLAGISYFTTKYAAADGAVLWQKSYSGRGAFYDLMGSFDPLDPEPNRAAGSHSLALGPNGMVAITGSSDGDFGPHGIYDYVTVVYREDLPLVSIARSNAFVILSWPVTGLNFQLQETTDLSLPNSWSPVAQSAVTNAGQISVTVSTTVGRKLLRLKSQ